VWADTERSRIGEERFRREHDCIIGSSIITVKWPNGKIEQISIIDLKQLLMSS
jgi:hypothetical protein